MGKLNGKIAVVTGASKGIGASIAEHLAAEGAKVVVNFANSPEGAGAVVNRIRAAGGEAVAIQADVAQPDQVARLFEETAAAFGGVDILVNNAGIYRFAPIEAEDPGHFHDQFNINVLGLLLATREAVQRMNGGGSVLNIGSIVGPMPIPNASVYSATKAAVDAITISLSQELGPRNIRVNSLNPGMVNTEGSRSAGIMESDFRRMVEAQTPLRRIADPEDIARAAVFLVSGDAGWITGQTVTAAGGMRQ